MNLTLPWPPSLNHYWRRVGAKTLISAEGRKYRKAVSDAVIEGRPSGLASRLRVEIRAYQPDRRIRDLDNMLKAPLDAMQHAGIYLSDSQIDALSIVREFDREMPRLEIAITEESNR